MYSIYADDICIYHDMAPLEAYKVVSPVLTMEDSAAGSLRMTVPKTNVGYDKIQKLVTSIRVLKHDEEIWSGRVLTEDRDFYNNRILYCEGELAFLNDTTQPQHEYHDISVRGFLEALISVHNEKAEADKQFAVGVVTVTDPNNSLYRYTNYENTLECINEKMVSRLGGHIRIRKENGVRYIDYLKNAPNTNSQVIRFGKNLLDFTQKWDVSEFATVILPLGARLEENENDIDALESYLTVESVYHETRIKSSPPVNLMTDGTDLVDLTVYGTATGVGDRTINEFDKDHARVVELFPNTTNGNAGISTSTYSRSLLIPVQPSSNYICWIDQPSGMDYRNRFRVAGYPTEPVNGSAAEFYNGTAVRNGDYVSVSFSTTANTHYILVMLWYGSTYNDSIVNNIIRTVDIQLQKGTTITSYEPYGKYKIPIRLSANNQTQTYNLILDAPLYSGQSVSTTDQGVTIPTVSEVQNTISINTTHQPGQIAVIYNSAEGQTFVQSYNAVDTYGRIEKVVNWDDVKQANNLLRKAKSYLSDIQFENLSLELTAVDLHYLDVDVEGVKLLDSIRVLSPPHGLDRYFPVTKLQIPLDSPSETTFTLGTNVQKSLTSTTHKASVDIRQTVEQMPKMAVILSEARAEATAILNQKTTGYITIVSDEQGSDALYISETQDYRNATRFWRFNMNGLGFTNNGGGTFTTAITMNGQIVADVVSTGTLNGSLLRAGSVQADAISQSFKTSIASDISGAMTTIRQEFAAADGTLRSTIEQEVENTYVTQTSFQQTTTDITTEVNKKVNNTDFGTKMTQNYDSFILGFNNNSTVIRISTSGFTFYEGGHIGKNNRLLELTDNGLRFWKTGQHIGNIGTNALDGDPSCRGLVFDLETSGKYMTWARKTSSSSTTFTVALSYSRANGLYTSEGIHLATSFYAHNNTFDGANLTNVSSDGTATFTGTKTFITAIRQTATGIEWDTETVTIKNGMFTN